MNPNKCCFECTADLKQANKRAEAAGAKLERIINRVKESPSRYLRAELEKCLADPLEIEAQAIYEAADSSWASHRPWSTLDEGGRGVWIRAALKAREIHGGK